MVGKKGGTNCWCVDLRYYLIVLVMLHHVQNIFKIHLPVVRCLNCTLREWSLFTAGGNGGLKGEHEKKSIKTGGNTIVF